mgnify:CR=1 FL=1
MEIEEGAYVQLDVKYGYIRLIRTKADLCKEMKNVELECPIEKGRISITKNVDLPNEIPPVRFPNISRLSVDRMFTNMTSFTYRASTPSWPTSTTRTTSTSLA